MYYTGTVLYQYYTVQYFSAALTKLLPDVSSQAVPVASSMGPKRSNAYVIRRGAGRTVAALAA
jgi:hypothetical protein